jgi:hypothetical protein
VLSEGAGQDGLLAVGIGGGMGWAEGAGCED